MIESAKDLSRVIYIMGTARSGSTVLEVILGSAQGAFGAGEITAFPQDGFKENKRCSCRKDIKECVVWSQVLRLLSINRDALRKWATIQRQVDWHRGFIKQIFFGISDRKIRDYERYNLKILAAIKETTHCDIIIDSSKYAGRALALHRILRKQVVFICLTRSPSGLMHSFQKSNKDEQYPKNKISTLIYYLVVLVSLRIACNRLGNQVYQLRYEDFVSSPTDTIEKIERWAKLDLSAAKQRIRSSQPFLVGHIVTGNRLRKKGKVMLKNNDQGRFASMAFGEKLVVGIMRIWQWGLRF
ncbi:MAG: hypothetical protein D3917_01785 [Candidatus Electrothrix sp. AX5]|jgi:hypothetical protein|nr:hypothetical protein [Candidatus Electrothrix sp. AX5]